MIVQSLKQGICVNTQDIYFVQCVGTIQIEQMIKSDVEKSIPSPTLKVKPKEKRKLGRPDQKGVKALNVVILVKTNL
ncbi:hypothetical protein HCG51_23615 [Tolypothrix sp. PCC 7910]|uniref:hypothetical protein n=1 Tax=Tolypothrix sp. PCC 7910 TaxID=2099387 RepID=UPI00142773A3|nr:hypothetical protein [Tolypothrix sp. PCC 7910]QIR35282.1 hypothetical protein HCG51_23615 [Tolypothrix sp. PCC 7910]